MKKQETKPALFRLGDIYITPGAQAALTIHAINPASLLDRHVTGECSNLSPDDIKANRDAVADGARIFSSYHNRAKNPSLDPHRSLACIKHVPPS